MVIIAKNSRRKPYTKAPLKGTISVVIEVDVLPPRPGKGSNLVTNPSQSRKWKDPPDDFADIQLVTPTLVPSMNAQEKNKSTEDLKSSSTTVKVFKASIGSRMIFQSILDRKLVEARAWTS